MNQQHFRSLQRFWDHKLKKSGFRDIENRRGDLVDSNWVRQSAKDPICFEAKEEYFYQATQFLNTYAFKNKIEKKIWEMHSNGETYPRISKVTKVYYTTANRIILRLKKIMLEELKRSDE